MYRMEEREEMIRNGRQAVSDYIGKWWLKATLSEDPTVESP
jgi:hypothetical protein